MATKKGSKKRSAKKAVKKVVKKVVKEVGKKAIKYGVPWIMNKSGKSDQMVTKKLRQLGVSRVGTRYDLKNLKTAMEVVKAFKKKK